LMIVVSLLPLTGAAAVAAPAGEGVPRLGH
jgi:hypothetical protein